MKGKVIKMTEFQIIELAKNLGKEIRESDKFKEYKAAKEAFLENSELGTMLSEFKVQKALLDQQAQLTNADEVVIDAIGARVETLFRQINEHPLYIRFQTAEQEFNMLISAVNTTIGSFIDDSEKSAQGSCSGNCSSCKSNCKH